MTKTRLRDDDLHAAADVLALAQTGRDGWLPVDKFPALQLASHPDSDTWATRLRALWTEQSNLSIVHACADEYPSNLRAVPSRPSLLFVEGDLVQGDARAVAIVGSRDATADALASTAQVAHTIAASGITVVSGLARGVDGAAHRGALAATGRTIAVMGTGIDLVFPAENTQLASAICSSGALLTQFPPGHGPTKTSFPARNAVIAGLSRCSLVMVAGERSGTRIEIDRALEHQRPVLLWAPLLRRRPWAEELARHPLVRFVDSADEVCSVVDASAVT